MSPAFEASFVLISEIIFSFPSFSHGCECVSDVTFISLQVPAGVCEDGFQEGGGAAVTF